MHVFGLVLMLSTSDEEEFVILVKYESLFL